MIKTSLIWLMLLASANTFASNRTVTFSKTENGWVKSLQLLAFPDREKNIRFEHNCEFDDLEVIDKSKGLMPYHVIVSSNPYPHFFVILDDHKINPMIIPNGESFSVLILCEERRGWGCW